MSNTFDFDSADSDYEASIMNTFAIIMADGTVELMSHALLSSICEVDVEFYPFDQQTCYLKFSSWTYDKEGVGVMTGKGWVS